MKIKIPLYVRDHHNIKQFWSGYQTDVVRTNNLPEKQGYIVQYYAENEAKMDRSNIYGNKFKFQDMLEQKKNKGFILSGLVELETSTGVFKEVA